MTTSPPLSTVCPQQAASALASTASLCYSPTPPPSATYCCFQLCAPKQNNQKADPVSAFLYLCESRLRGAFAFPKKPLVCWEVCQFAGKNTRKTNKKQPIWNLNTIWAVFCLYTCCFCPNMV